MEEEKQSNEIKEVKFADHEIRDYVQMTDCHKRWVKSKPILIDSDDYVLDA